MQLTIRSAVRVMGMALGIWAGLQGGPASASPPANDTCAGSVVIPSTSFPYLTPVLTNMHEATLPGDPVPTTNCVVGAVKGVWYRFTPSLSGLYTISTGDDTATTALDTILAVYAAPNCGTVTNQIECNDDSGASNLRAGLTVTLVAGTNYYIVVSLSVADNNTGPLSLQLRVDRPGLPSNDTCATAEVIPNNQGFPRKSAIYETVRAGTEAGAPSCAAGFRSVWFKFTPATNGTYILATGTDTSTTVFDTLMVLYSSTGGSCGTLTEVTCSDNGEARGSILRSLTGGTAYYIAVHDKTSPPIVSETTIQLSIATPTPPSVTTLPVVSLSSTGVVVAGIVNPNGLQSRYWFEWGPTIPYSNISDRKVLFAGTASTNINLILAGHMPNITNHYRLVATNNTGRSDGLDQTFIWKTNRPALSFPEPNPMTGNVRLSFSGNPRQIYRMDTSTNLVEWTSLGHATEAPANSGMFIHTHIGAGAAPRRYYRIVSP